MSTTAATDGVLRYHVPVEKTVERAPESDKDALLDVLGDESLFAAEEMRKQEEEERAREEVARKKKAKKKERPMMWNAMLREYVPVPDNSNDLDSWR